MFQKFDVKVVFAQFSSLHLEIAKGKKINLRHKLKNNKNKEKTRKHNTKQIIYMQYKNKTIEFLVKVNKGSSHPRKTVKKQTLSARGGSTPVH